MNRHKRTLRQSGQQHRKLKFVSVIPSKVGLFGLEIQANHCMASLAKYEEITYKAGDGRTRVKTIQYALQCTRDHHTTAKGVVHKDKAGRTWS